MDITWRVSFRLALLVALLAVGAATASCSSERAADDDESVTAHEADDAECGAAFVDFVSVQQGSDGQYMAIVQGHYPSACDELGEVSQVVEGESITITMCSTRPPDMACAAILTPFTETIPIDTDALDPGDYAVVVNDRSENANRTPATLTVE